MQGFMLLGPAFVKQGCYEYPPDGVIAEVPETLFAGVS